MLGHCERAVNQGLTRLSGRSALHPPQVGRRESGTAGVGKVRETAAADVSPDGKRFLMLRETTPTDRNELIVVQNWVEEMKARGKP